jgi:predicted alpha/beta-hydrolase family hydrolase
MDGPKSSQFRVVLAHGAGAPMDSEFMETVASGLARAGIGVVRFEFPYMRIRRKSGGRRPPDRIAVLLDSYRSVIASLGPADRLFIGGKSMGGRVASMVADACGVRGLICMGYPFHPPRRPDRLRTEHLAQLATPTLILHGTRDPFGVPDEIAGYDLASSIRVRYLEDGDHSFKPRKRSGRTEDQNIEQANRWIVEFVERSSD